jgi:Spy/CpxP family protein refolding chaperone
MPSRIVLPGIVLAAVVLVAVGAAWALTPPPPGPRGRHAPCYGYGDGPGSADCPCLDATLDPDGEYVPHPGHWRGHHHGHGPLARLDRLPAELALTAEQREGVREIMEGARSEMDALAEELDLRRDALHDAIHSETLDESAIRRSSKDLADVQADMAMARARHLTQIMALLSPGQREYMQRHFEYRQERRDLRSGRGGRRGWR